MVPQRYYKEALANVPVRDIRMLGGKLGKQLRDAGIEKMGDIQLLEISDLVPLVGN